MKKNTPKSDKKHSHLSLEEREEIAIGLENGMKQGEIALRIGRSPSTISRELQRNSPSLRTVKYRANRAQMRADERKEQKNKRERIPNKRLRRFICKYLKSLLLKRRKETANGKPITNRSTNGSITTVRI